MIKKLYPNGKNKAYVFSYDDGTLEDLIFVKLLNKYKIKATFNLNSKLMMEKFSWIHETGQKITRLSFDESRNLYDGHEIASHSYSHPYLSELNHEQIIYEMLRDKVILEREFKTKIYGFALPFDTLTWDISKCARDVGFEYLRASETSNSLIPDYDYFNFRASVFHLDDNLNDLVDEFLTTDEELACLQIIGHSYDLKIANKFDYIEGILKTLSEDEDAINLTSIELVRYLKAIRTVTINHQSIINASNEILWFNIDGKIIKVLPKSKYFL